MKKVLITGGAGFIGSHTVDMAIERGLEPIIFDCQLLGYHRDDVKVINSSVTDREELRKILSECDGVIHLAAILGTQETINRPQEIVRTNVLGTLNVFELATEFEIPCVYIAVGNYWMNNPYSISKTTSERFVTMFNREKGSRIATVRGLNAYGPRQKQFPVRKIMPNFVIPAINNEEILVYGSGNQIMDMVYVRDLGAILVDTLLNIDSAMGTVIQAGMGLDTTVNYLANEVVRLADSTSKIVHADMRPGETPDSVVKADTSSLAKIGWSEDKLMPLEEGILETIKYYRENI